MPQQLAWSHFKELLPVSDELKREFYAVLCKNDIQLLEVKDIMTADMFYRDPCILDFLGLQDTNSEKDLENAVLAELENIILEIGTDFAFMARQKRVTIHGKDYKIDLMFSIEN